MVDTAELWQVIRLAALENAVKFKGQANPKAVLGSVMKALPEAKDDMELVRTEIAAILLEINDLSSQEQEEELLRLKPHHYEEEKAKRKQRKQERQELPELDDVTPGHIVTRLAPEPSKYNHLGHAFSFLINYLYAKKYEGKCALRFEDTNPEKSTQEYVDAMEHDLFEYLGITPDTVVFASDHVPKFHEAAADLITRRLAYTCTCDSATMSKLRRNMKPCGCRDKDVKTVEQDWMKMIEGKQPEGSMTLRLKIDMEHKNAVMRDPVIMRIIHAEHYRQGNEYKVWPMYDFENALEDGWMGVTYVFRSDEFASRIELQEHIKSLFKLPLPHIKQYGRVSVTGMSAKGREIREAIESGEMIGWDDPRLLTLRALHRRGIVPEAIYELVKKIGMSKAPTNLDFDVIAAINRRILDEQANRYFFVEDPQQITVVDWPIGYDKVELKLHPHHRRGGRELKLDGEFYLAKKDYEQLLDGKPFRLIDTINLYYDTETKEFKVHSMSIDEFRSVEEKHGLIHFLPVNEHHVYTEIYSADGFRIGLAEPAVAPLRPGAIIQFERECFARLDEIEEKDKKKVYTFWYAHD